MKLKGEVVKLEDVGHAGRVSVANVRAVTQAPGSPYQPPVAFDVPTSHCVHFPIGRKVTITIQPVRKRR